MTASVPSAAVQKVGGSNLTSYLFVLFIAVLVFALMTYLMVEYGREKRALQTQHPA